MNARSLMLLAAATGVVAIIAVVTQKRRESAVRSATESAKLFPGLLTSINDVGTIAVKRKSESYTLHKSGERWSLVEKNDYPVDIEPVRKALLGIADLTTVEAKTNDPARYAQLGLEDPDAEGSTSALVTLKDKSGKELAALVVGKPHASKNATGMGTGQLYVRKPGDPRTWLAKGELEIHEKSSDWLDKKILELKRDRVHSVEVQHPDGEIVHVERTGPNVNDFVVRDMPADKDLKYPTIASSMSSALEWLNLEDVVPLAQVDFKASPGAVSRFTTFDGLTVTVTTKDEGEKTYARFEATYAEPPPDATPAVGPEEKQDDDPAQAEVAKPEKRKPEEVQKEAAELNARLAPWAFVIPAYNRATFAKHMADLVKDKAPPPSDVNPDTGESKDKPLIIPGDLDPEIQAQIKADQEARGNKVIIAPPKEKPPEEPTPPKTETDEKDKEKPPPPPENKPPEH